MFVGTVALEEPLKSNIRLFERVRLVSSEVFGPKLLQLSQGPKDVKKGVVISGYHGYQKNDWGHDLSFFGLKFSSMTSLNSS